jgi:GT2 family glycosyltransferase
VVVADCKDPDLEAVDAAIGARPYPVRRLVGRLPGLAANRNTGWSAARAPIVLFTDNDTVPVRRLVSEHLEWHSANPAPEVVVVGHVRWARGLEVTAFMKWLDRGLQFDYQSLRGDQGTWAHIYGANSSIKVAVLERVGGYDEVRLPYLYEDLDWGRRARDHGVRVLYNRRAIVDHWKPATLDAWRTRAPQLAATEWMFTRLHPDVEPWFHRAFSDAMTQPPARGRGARLARWVPRGVPWLGRRVWDKASVYWRQQIAPGFLSAWEQAASEAGRSTQPDVSALLAERASSPGGS